VRARALRSAQLFAAACSAAALTPLRVLLRSEPVDPIALGIPDYFDVIKNPMDLGTILSRLGRGFYADTSDVLRGSCAGGGGGSCARARRGAR
jgi:hypothetical protein